MRVKDLVAIPLIAAGLLNAASTAETKAVAAVRKQAEHAWKVKDVYVTAKHGLVLQLADTSPISQPQLLVMIWTICYTLEENKASPLFTSITVGNLYRRSGYVFEQPKLCPPILEAETPSGNVMIRSLTHQSSVSDFKR